MCMGILRDVAKQGTLQFIPAARCPIIKFEERETGLDVDFNVNNVLGLVNSDLIFTYCQIDQRFHIINTFLKYWAKQVGIIGASNGFLSSYSFTLLIIAYLQSTEPPVLPCI